MSATATGGHERGIEARRRGPRVPARLLRLASDERLVDCPARRVGGGLRGHLRAPSSRRPLLLPAHARLRRGGRGRRPAHVHGRLPRPPALLQADPAAAVALRDRPQPLPQRAAGAPRADVGRARRSRRPSTSRARSSAGTTCGPCSATSPRSRPTSAPRSCSPSWGTCRTTRSATSSGCPKEKVKALVFQARSSLIASRTARETSCAEIREQLANLRGGSLRRNTLAAPPARVRGLPRVPRPGARAAGRAGADPARRPDVGPQGGGAGRGGGHGRRGVGVGRGHRRRRAVRGRRGNGGRRHRPRRRREAAGGTGAPARAGGAGGRRAGDGGRRALGGAEDPSRNRTGRSQGEAPPQAGARGGRGARGAQGQGAGEGREPGGRAARPAQGPKPKAARSAARSRGRQGPRRSRRPTRLARRSRRPRRSARRSRRPRRSAARSPRRPPARSPRARPASR